MANFARIKALGWSLFERLTSAQMNQLDIDHAKAINGDDGGTWNGPIILSDLTMSGTAKVKLASRSITRIQETVGIVLGTSTTHWHDMGFGPKNGADGTSPNTFTSGIRLPIHLPQGVTLTGVELTVDPASGHAAFPGGQPANMPNFEIKKHDITQNFDLSIGASPYVDPTTGSVGAYEAIHSWSATGLTEVIDKTTKKYYLVFFSESGANSRSGLVINGWKVTYTTTAYDED